DQLAGPEHKFDYMLSNPPFGVTWGGKDGYEKEAMKYQTNRYQAGMPRTNDGALLFLQTMLAKMKPVRQGGSRIAIILNGSPLSNGDCGSGESEIRRYILENDQPAYLTEPYTKAFTPPNIKKEQQFYESDLDFRIHLKLDTVEREISFTLSPEDSFVKIFEKEVKVVFAEKIANLTESLKKAKDKNKAIKAFIRGLEVAAKFTHRNYISDNEYIQYGEDIETFLKREIGKPIIRWIDSPQLGYEILPNKYFYKYQPPKPADELLKEFWALEEEAEKMLGGLGINKKW
ncbi:MAG: SAM-dependent DNA methyltransferase, partial [Deltaproteobacteria bacterium]|nr:SAM-dependent DNA methyltransferase [Deltaproteobacteria bacterium]